LRIALDESREFWSSMDVILHPGNDHVLFSQGGNVKFRCVLKQHVDEFLSAEKDVEKLKEVRDTPMLMMVEDFDVGEENELVGSYFRSGRFGGQGFIFFVLSRQKNECSLFASQKNQVSTGGSIQFLHGNKRQKLEGKQLCCND
jgi:hypothetical protein